MRLEGCCDCGLVHLHDYRVENGKVMEYVESA
jgi:hypothetical protein